MNIRFLTTLIFCAFVFSLESVAFTLTSYPPVYFQNSEVKVNVSTASCGSAITTSEIMSYVTSAAEEYWNTVSTSSLNMIPGDFVSTDLSGVTGTTFSNKTAFSVITDNTILVGCNDLNTNFADQNVTSSVLAGASIASLSSGKIVGMVLINTNADFSDESQNIAVLAHEIGHALGLGHSSDPIALMFYSVGAKTQERLTMSDRDGITYLYPHEKKIPASCGSIALIGNNDDNDNSGGSGPLSFVFGLLAVALFAEIIKKLSKNTKLSRKTLFYGIFSKL